MVVLSKIYTRTGDRGTTALGDGRRVRKDHLRIAAFGDVDELNSVLGLALMVVPGRGQIVVPNAAPPEGSEGR